MPLLRPDGYEHSNSRISIVDSSNVKGGLKQVYTFANGASGLGDFNGYENKFKKGTLLIALDTKMLYYLTGATVTDVNSWTPIDTLGQLGPQGFQGASGSVGSIGPRGFQGFQGIIGITGPTGVNGTYGPQGSVGPTGYGLRGFQGFQGFQGVLGNPGPQGIAGPQGPDTFEYNIMFYFEIEANDLYDDASTITKVLKTSSINTVKYRFNSTGSWVTLSVPFTGTIGVSASSTVNWQVTYLPGTNTGSLLIKGNKN